MKLTVRLSLIAVAMALVLVSCAKATPTPAPVATPAAAATPKPVATPRPTPTKAPVKAKILKYADLGPPTSTRGKAMLWWADEVEERTGGRLKIEFYWSGSLVKGKDTMEAVGAGTAEMGTTLAMYHPAKTPLWTVGDLPYGPSDYYVGLMAITDLRRTDPALDAETALWNVKVMHNFTAGSVQLLTSEPVTTMADIKGKKIRAFGLWSKLLKELGATPVALGFGDVYTALERNTIDGSTDYIWAAKGYRHFEVAKHMTLTNMGLVLGYGATINLDVWNKLSPDLQKIMTDLSRDMTVEYARRLIAEEAKIAKEAPQEFGVQFHELAPGEMENWRQKGMAFWDGWVEDREAEGRPGKRLLEKYLSLVDKYQQEVKTKGYPWESK